MKRMIALFVCALALTACGNQSDSSSNDQSANNASDSSASTANQSADSGGDPSASSADDSKASDNGSGDATEADSDSSDASADQGSAQSNDQSNDQANDKSNDQANDQNSDQTSDQAGDQQAADNSQGDSGKSSGSLDTKKARRSYALGMDIGNSLKSMPMDVDMDQLTQGMRDVINGAKTKLTPKQQKAVMQGVVTDMQAAQKKQEQQQSKANLQAGKQFLAKNKNKDGVKTLDDGLQYKVIKKGSGAQPDANDSVTVDYTGKLIDGTVFDSSEKRGKPVTFPVNAVIPGWTEALQLMHAGGEYKLFIPPSLAYGERGAGSQIGPNETLIFDVKLISVDKTKGKGETNGDDTQSSGQNSDQNSQDNSDQGADQGSSQNSDQSSGQTSDQPSGQNSSDQKSANQ